MKKLIIIGASGFGREVAWLVERINQKLPVWELLGFLDDNEDLQGQAVNGIPVLGKTVDVAEFSDAYFVCAVGSSVIRKKIIERVKSINPEILFGTVIDPSVEMSKFVSIGEGTIICAHTILTVNIEIGDHVIINLDCTIGHDAIIHDFATLYPSVNISGFVQIGECCELGTGMQIIQGKKVGPNVVIGAGGVVVKDCNEIGTYVGSPVKRIG